MNWGGWMGYWVGGARAVVPACAGMTVRGTGMAERVRGCAGAAWAIGARRERGRHDQCARSQRPTPHLTSPLKGGRDELGRMGGH